MKAGHLFCHLPPLQTMNSYLVYLLEDGGNDSYHLIRAPCLHSAGVAKLPYFSSTLLQADQTIPLLPHCIWLKQDIVTLMIAFLISGSNYSLIAILDLV